MVSRDFEIITERFVKRNKIKDIAKKLGIAKNTLLLKISRIKKRYGIEEIPCVNLEKSNLHPFFIFFTVKKGTMSNEINILSILENYKEIGQVFNVSGAVSDLKFDGIMLLYCKTNENFEEVRSNILTDLKDVLDDYWFFIPSKEYFMNFVPLREGVFGLCKEEK